MNHVGGRVKGEVKVTGEIELKAELRKQNLDLLFTIFLPFKRFSDLESV